MAVEFGGQPCIDPVMALQECQRNNLPVGTWVNRANSITIPIGTKPGQGWLLMTRGSLDILDLDALHDLLFISIDQFAQRRTQLKHKGTGR